MANYFSAIYLETEIKKNSSVIYKALLKYGYSATVRAPGTLT